MSKDPAFLFYSQDFYTGTVFFTDEQVGKYIRILCLQHQTGHLTENHMLNICKTYDKDIFSKFIRDSDGLYYNERLEGEIVRRVSYCENRKKNRLSEKTYVQHMETENETETKTVIKNNNKGAKNKKFIPPTIDEVKQYFKESGYSENCAVNAFEYYSDLDWHDKNDNPVLNWKMKMRKVWFKDEHKLQETTDYSPLNDILKTLKK